MSRAIKGNKIYRETQDIGNSEHNKLQISIDKLVYSQTDANKTTE